MTEEVASRRGVTMAVGPQTGLAPVRLVAGDPQTWRAAGWLVLACATLGAGLVALAEDAEGRVVGLALLVGVIGALVRSYLSERRALLQLRRAYEEGAEERRQFIATVSHDFRSPLTAVIGFTQLLSEHGEGLDSARSRDYLRMIREQSQQLGRMIEDTVDLSRLTERRLNISPATRRLEEVAEGALALLDHPEDRRRIQLAIAPEAAEVVADQYELEQVLDRLFHCALAAGDTGSEVTLATTAGAGGKVQLSLRADGLRAEADQFRPFLGDLAAGLARGREVRYLTMATVRGLVELQGGTVSAREGEIVVTLRAASA